MNLKSSGRCLPLAFALLFLILAALFLKSCSGQYVVHNNDAPLGALVSESGQMPGILTGYWKDLNWLGGELPSAAPTVSALFYNVLGGIGYAKFNAPLSLLVLGLCTFFCLRSFGFHCSVSMVGAIAIVLNGNIFSNACWGQTSRSYALASAFLAIGLLQSGARNSMLPKAALAGLAVGWGVVEAFDVGAIFSVYVAAFCLALFVLERSGQIRLGKAVIAFSILVLFAGFFAAQTLNTLVSTQIQGVIGTEQTAEARAAKWNEATQWSTPKIETLRVLIPGSHGYRMDTPEGGQYWGRVGQSAGWGDDMNRDGEPDRMGLARFSGSGEYAGILVVLMAIYAIAQSFRRKESIFTEKERKFIWFWSGLALISLLLAWGRYAPFYEIVYQIPYFSTIRNPMKFMHPFHMILIILFGYGLQGLYRRHVESVTTRAASFSDQWKKFWSGASSFDRKWVAGCVIVLGISVLAWLIFNSSSKSFERHLVDFAGLDGGLAGATAKFTLREVGLFVLFLALSIGALLVVMSGWLSGARAKWAGILLGLILTVDLARANLPWIVYYDYKDKYASNPVIDKLREEPYKHRVTKFSAVFQQADYFNQLYDIEWLQQHFQFYNIQSLDIIQMPREPVDYAAFAGMASGAFPIRNGYVADRNHLPLAPRYWQLTNTRYILAPAAVVEALNAQFGEGLFKAAMRFNVVPKAGRQVRRLEDLTVNVDPNGQYALIELTNALPRAKLYSNWQVITNEALVSTNYQTVTTGSGIVTNAVAVTNSLTLQRLKSPEFNPLEQVLVSSDKRVPNPTSPQAEAGTVEFSSYAPKKIVLTATAKVPAMLLLNDKYDPNWRVTVDGQPAELLRLNYIMRGVHLEPGTHEVVFTFEPPVTSLYISLAAIAVGLLLCGYLAVARRRESEDASLQKS